MAERGFWNPVMGLAPKDELLDADEFPRPTTDRDEVGAFGDGVGLRDGVERTLGLTDEEEPYGCQEGVAGLRVIETGAGLAGRRGTDVIGLGADRFLLGCAGFEGRDAIGLEGVNPPTEALGFLGVDETGVDGFKPPTVARGFVGLDVTGFDGRKPPTDARGLVGVDVTGFGGVLESSPREAAGCADGVPVEKRRELGRP